jgi:diguanylate cyclase (GGDEF)-like protein
MGFRRDRVGEAKAAMARLFIQEFSDVFRDAPPVSTATGAAGVAEIVEEIMPLDQGLAKKLSSSKRLPTAPGAVIRLLELTRRPDVSGKEIVEAVALDPNLSAKILRFVNSPLAGVSREVTSLQQAVALTGFSGVTTIALSFAVLAQRGGPVCKGFDGNRFAAQSVGCAAAAKVLAVAARTGSGQEAFLAGLLSQIGRATLAVSMPKEYARVLKQAKQVPADLPALEKAAFGETYPTIGAWLLRNWSIPAPLCQAIEVFRNVDEAADAPPLARVLHVAELAMSVVCTHDENHGAAIDAFVQAAKRHLKVKPEDCGRILSEVAAEAKSTQDLLDVPAAQSLSPEELEMAVRERIAELSVAMHLENQNMMKQQEELLYRATTDPLTGVGNRAAFDARMSLELERAARAGTPFALIMIDVDRFKAFNDSYGHPAGDRVLQSIGQLLDQNIRKVDYLSRYGGEEFAVIAPATSAEGVALLAERLRASVEAHSIVWEGKRLAVTISLGAAVVSDVADARDAAWIIKAADQQLYISKRGGRNRVEVAVDSVRLHPAAQPV